MSYPFLLLHFFDNYLDIAWSTDRIGNFQLIIPSISVQNRPKSAILPTMIASLLFCHNRCLFCILIITDHLKIVNQLKFLGRYLRRILHLMLVKLVKKVQLVINRLFLGAAAKLILLISTASTAPGCHLHLHCTLTANRTTAVVIDIVCATAEDCLRYLSQQATRWGLLLLLLLCCRWLIEILLFLLINWWHIALICSWKGHQVDFIADTLSSAILVISWRTTNRTSANTLFLVVVSVIVQNFRCLFQGKMSRNHQCHTVLLSFLFFI